MAQEYKVISHHYQEAFEKEVNRRMGDGWVPLGGVSTSHYGSPGNWHCEYAQGMVREIKPDG